MACIECVFRVRRPALKYPSQIVSIAAPKSPTTVNPPSMLRPTPPPPAAKPESRLPAAECCLVLMMKSAARSKRRLARAIGDERATEAARHLIECVREDLESWPGPVCVALADAAEGAMLGGSLADAVVVQQGGNLGERINHVNAVLVEQGFERQLYVGIDCPAIDAQYLERAAEALTDCNVVFGPAADGGVVLMGVGGRWPDLSPLPWSTDALFDALRAACVDAGARASVLEPLRDVDTLEDLWALADTLDGDPRPARRALAQWLSKIKQSHVE